MQWQCKCCLIASEKCHVNLNSACVQCKKKKQRCSFMPQNDETGKTDHHPMVDEKLYKFQVGQAIKRGKQWALDPPDAGEAEGSSQAPSPLSALDSLEMLNLDSSGSSAVNTPANSPTTFPWPSLTETLALPPLSVPKTHKTGTSWSLAGKSIFRPSVAAPIENIWQVMPLKC